MVKFKNLSTIQGQITHCLYSFYSVKIAPINFKTGFCFTAHFDHFFPFPILPRGRSIEDYKVDSEDKLFAYLYVQIVYIYSMCMSISKFNYVNSSTPAAGRSSLKLLKMN